MISSGNQATTVAPYSGERDDWDDFVRRTPRGTFFHLIGWKQIIEEAFGFRSHYLVARRAGEIAGVLPLFLVRRPFSRSCLLSVPFAVAGGVCAADTEAQAAIDEAALRLMGDLGAGYLELRDGIEGAGFRTREGLYYRFRRALLPTDEENLAAIPRKQRRMVRVAQQSGLVSRISTDDFDAFYDLYARSVRNLGTPVFPRQYFRLFMKHFPDDCIILTVRKGDSVVAAVMSFFFNGTVLPYYAGSRQEYFRYAVNDFMYWELMRHARARGAQVFDFGRSKKGTGAFDFKCHWGFEPEPLRYRVHAAGNGAAPDHSTSNIQLLRRLWRQMPLPLTKLLGPFFIRHFGAQYT